jgi:hypothetical protein
MDTYTLRWSQMQALGGDIWSERDRWSAPQRSWECLVFNHPTRKKKKQTLQDFVQRTEKFEPFVPESSWLPPRTLARLAMLDLT